MLLRLIFLKMILLLLFWEYHLLMGLPLARMQK